MRAGTRKIDTTPLKEEDVKIGMTAYNRRGGILRITGKLAGPNFSFESEDGSTGLFNIKDVPTYRVLSPLTEQDIKDIGLDLQPNVGTKYLEAEERFNIDKTGKGRRRKTRKTRKTSRKTRRRSNGFRA